MLTRRRFVKLLGGAAALAAAPLPIGCGDNLHETRGIFFDENAWAAIDIATGFILPGDRAARDSMAVRYIDTLLAAFTVDPPAIFAGGPFSGRTAFPDAHGNPTAQFPDNNFAQFLPLSRVQDIAWRIRIFGSAATPGGDFNDAVLGPTTGLQAIYLGGIQALDDAAHEVMAHWPFRLLQPDDQSRVLDTVADQLPDFWNALVNHTLEGTFCAPEYGGNVLTIGWHLVDYDGDSAPLGHATYDATADAYVDRSDEPTSQPSPGDVTETFDTDIINALTVAAIGSGGMRFF